LLPERNFAKYSLNLAPDRLCQEMPKIDDLYLPFREILAAGMATIHPHRWLHREAHHPLSIGFMDYSFAKNSKLRPGQPTSFGPPLRIDGIAITEVSDARAALKRCGRRSQPGVYLAHSLVSQRYTKYLPTGVEVQNALKDCLKETLPSVQFEVRTPVGQVDCVTDDAIYEVAKLDSWKHALGQLCAYKLHLTRLKTILYLYGPAENPRALEKATRTCIQYGIVVKYKRYSALGTCVSAFQRPRTESVDEGI
jgi:hypothetical protein